VNVVFRLREELVGPALDECRRLVAREELLVAKFGGPLERSVGVVGPEAVETERVSRPAVCHGP
jgi:hypothetical protein